MNLIRLTPNSFRKIGVNKKCPCGSESKFKRCCRYMASLSLPDPRKQSVETEQVHILISKFLITGLRSTLSEIEKILKKLSFHFALGLMCSLNYELYRYEGHGDKKWQIQLMKRFFQDYWFSKCYYILEFHSKSIFFSDITGLFLIKLIILFSDTAKKSQIPLNEFKNFGDVCLMINDFIVSEKIDLKDFELDIIKSTYSKNDETSLNIKISNSYILYSYYAKNIQILGSKNADYIDLDKIFKEATGGLSFENYFLLLFGLLSNFLKPEKYEPANRVTFFNLFKIDPFLVDRFWDLVSLPYEKYRNLLLDDINNKGIKIEQSAYRNSIFIKYPLIVYENQAFCIDVDFLANKFLWGPYWIILDYLKNDKIKGNKFTRYWGQLYELFIQEMLLSDLKDLKIKTKVRCKKNPESNPEIDALIKIKDNLLVFEITKYFPKIEAMMDPSVKEWKEWLDTSIYKKIDQLKANIDFLRKDKFALNGEITGKEQIYPIIVTPFKLPQNEYIYKKFYESKIQEFLKNDEKVHFPIFLNTEELIELISTYDSKGEEGFLNIINGKITGDNRYINFHNHKCFNYPGWAKLSTKFIDKMYKEHTKGLIEQAEYFLKGATQA